MWFRVGHVAHRDRPRGRRGVLLRGEGKHKASYDDALDVVGVHFVGGLLGSILIGFCADPDFFGAEFGKGIFFGGRPGRDLP